MLVTGGAGYIGSHALKVLQTAGHAVLALDDLRVGHRAAVRDVKLIEAEVQDRAVVEQLLRRQKIDAVLHFAAYCYVGESVQKPAKYYANNTLGTLRLAEACVRVGVKAFVLSSTCATYGEPKTIPIDEATPQNPVNPYGRSKLMAEWVLRDLALANPGFRPIFLRYFNAAGASIDGELGEDHEPETHLIPNAILAALGRREILEIYGDDYPTRDGTCVRDYIHVDDLAAAHVLALEYATNDGTEQAFNLGNGVGFTVKEVIAEVERVTGKPVPFVVKPRRAGDPPELVAAAQKARTILRWEPRHADLETIVRTSYRWLQSHPKGYADRVGRK